MAWAAAQPGSGQAEMTLRSCGRLGGFEPDLRHRSNDLLVLLQLVRRTGAAALLPDLIEADDDPTVVLRTPREGRIEREVFGLQRPQSTSRPAVAAFTAVLDEVVSARAAAPPRGRGPARPGA